MFYYTFIKATNITTLVQHQSTIINLNPKESLLIKDPIYYVLC